MTPEIEKIDTKKRILTLFILFFPTIIIALMPTIEGTSFWLLWALRLLLVFYQFVVLKNFVDSHYS